MKVKGAPVSATRPWKIFGEGPNMIKAGSFQGNSISKLGAQDIRFTRNKTNTVINAIFLGWPQGEVIIKALGTSAATNPGKIENVQLLGTDERVRWTQRPDGLHVELPKHYHPAVNFAASLRVSLA